MTDAISDEFERALAGLCSDERLRAIESGTIADVDTQWAEIDALGFTDALVATEKGGVGLSLEEAWPLLLAAGHAGLSMPFGETMIARALLIDRGWINDGGCIAIARAQNSDEDAVTVLDVSGALLARHVLVERADVWLLMPRDKAQIVAGAYRPHASATLRWESTKDAVFSMARGSEGAESVCSAVHAAAMAGAMQRVLALTVEYANDRRQFGKAIGQFQAIQQELAVLAEQASSTVMAARMGCAASGALPDPLLAAVAKLRACEAAEKVSTVAHAVHGAIGITREHMLGVFTNRLHEWRMSPGSELSCAMQVGQALVTSEEASLIDFVRVRLTAGAASAR
jgi:alkylation response protein AidB-like acyl-CoA dehydrogenase